MKTAEFLTRIARRLVRVRKHSVPLAMIVALIALHNSGDQTNAQAPKRRVPVHPLVLAERNKLQQPPLTAERQLARLTILEPAALEAELNKHKTQQEIEGEQIAIFAITQPKAYSIDLEKFKDGERKQKEQQARSAVLEPARHSGRIEDLNDEVRGKKERGEEVDPILSPKFVSGNSPGKPAESPPKRIRD
jgi:hypothetical protein